jgi:S-formylglutathione hydrolase FrmB
MLLATVAVLGLTAVPASASGGLELLARHRLDSRLLELRFTTPAVPSPTGVRVLLPAGYGASHRRYPVLYLLHGALGDETSWTTQGDAERITAGRPLIVVMPATGHTSGYVNWADRSQGRHDWERYHIDQLIPWIDAHLRTRAERDGRAVAGLSMGGFGAMSYAARHPDRFVAAASFSGAVDTNNPLDQAVTDDKPFGPRATEEVRWRAANPWDLAGNLRPLRLVVRTGNGQAGGPFGGGDVVELAVHQMSVAFHDRLDALGIPHVWDDYGPGGHLWPYWQRDLRRTLPLLMRTFRRPPPAPRRASFRAVEPRYRVFGWSVALRRRALEWSALRDASRRGFGLCGSGQATVRTPRVVAPGARVALRVRDARGARTRHGRADRRGRLTVRVGLGPSNPVQEYRPGARTVVRCARVRVVR